MKKILALILCFSLFTPLNSDTQGVTQQILKNILQARWINLSAYETHSITYEPHLGICQKGE